MDTTTLLQSLYPLFTPESPIVFRDDADGEFGELLGGPAPELTEHGITLVRRAEIADLELKMQLELNTVPEKYFLLYAAANTTGPHSMRTATGCRCMHACMTDWRLCSAYRH